MDPKVTSDLIFDVGLHKGEDTAFYLAKGYRVVAFEANPDLIAFCKERFNLPIAEGRLHIVEGAITFEPVDEVVFYQNESDSAWGTIYPKWVTRNQALGTRSKAIKVPRVDIVEAFRNYGLPHYLKIDVEGADSIVLAALKQFKDRPRYVSIESEKVDFAALEHEFAVLVSLGYRRFRPVQQVFVPGSRVCAKTRSGEPFEYLFEPDASGPFGDDLDIPWLSREECLAAYRKIFPRYRLFGDRSQVRRIKGSWRVLKLVENIAHVALPGWYDTHATL